jgi:hypothetical protein
LLFRNVKKSRGQKLETALLKGYEIEQVEELDNRIDMKSTLINLEWLYLPILDSYGTKEIPKLLEEKLANSQIFFIKVLKWLHSQSKNIRKEEKELKMK